jgi:type II secretory pathway component GspD/PulD (secretin)
MKQITATLLGLVFAFELSSPSAAFAQPTAGEQKPAAAEQKPARIIQCPNPTSDSVRTFYLRNATQTSEANEVFTLIRQMLPADTRSFFVPSQNAITVCAQSDQLELAQKLIADMDHAKRDYKLMYSVTDIEGAARVGTRHYSLIVSPGQESTLKQGSRVPIPTSANSVTYVDVGMNVTATIDVTVSGIRLRTSVEQSSTAEPKTGDSQQNPIIRQASFKGTSFLVPGKPLKLGTFDIADTNRHLELEVMMEPIP